MDTDGKWLNDSDTLTLIPPSRDAIASKNMSIVVFIW